MNNAIDEMYFTFGNKYVNRVSSTNVMENRECFIILFYERLRANITYFLPSFSFSSP